MRKIISFWLMLGAILLINYTSALSQNTKIDWSSFNMGFAKSQTTNTIVSSVVGQNFVGTSLQGNTQVISGFLADTLLRSTLVAVKDNKELPATYSLEQNYPNPFNPNTNIEYKILKIGFVSLKIYDILGQEVETLVNEEKQPGIYKINWDASGFPSGVYFYRLQASSLSASSGQNFIETKKLILMK